MTIISDGVKDREYRPAEEKLLWVPLYEAVLSILGSTGVILPIGDTNYENSDRTTLTTVGEEAAVFTYSEAVSAFDTAPSISGPSRIPIIHFNGTDEEVDTPDAAYWSRGDGVNDFAFSVGVWANVTDMALSRTLLSKWDSASGSESREWRLMVRTNDILRFQFYDESVNVASNRNSDSAITMDSLRLFVATYDGAGGASASDNVVLYENGVVKVSTASNNASYVSMEDLATLPKLGSRIVNGGLSGDFFIGSMAGGPLGPFFTQTELTADAVLRLYQLGRAALDV